MKQAGELHTLLHQDALEHGWHTWWEHVFPNGTHLGLRRGDYRMSLTFNGPYPKPELDGTIDHCGLFKAGHLTWRVTTKESATVQSWLANPGLTDDMPSVL